MTQQKIQNERLLCSDGALELTDADLAQVQGARESKHEDRWFPHDPDDWRYRQNDWWYRQNDWWYRQNDWWYYRQHPWFHRDHDDWDRR